MPPLSFLARRGFATVLLTSAMLPHVAATTAQGMAARDDGNLQTNAISPIVPPVKATAPVFGPGTTFTVPAFAPLFITPADAHAFWEMQRRSAGWTMLDPKSVARAFIKERLGIDGDDYVVAHFATTEKLLEGSADNVIPLTEALMTAFPDHTRRSFFGALADGVAGLNGGGHSPSLPGFLRDIFTCGNASECLSRAGRFLWSRTGPGYIYNTFIGQGNVVDTLVEDARPLNMAFGIFPRSASFLPQHRSALLLSEVIDKFKEEGLFSELPYIKRMNAEFERYWQDGRQDWPRLARYRFVHDARRAFALGVLTRPQYEMVMKGAAPLVPLYGPISMQKLHSSPLDASADVRRFDINDYASTDIVRFVARDGSEVMYIPGSLSPFLAFRNEDELRRWVVGQARHPASLDRLLSHFSIFQSQDGPLWTGVAQSLVKLANGTWVPDDRAIDVREKHIRDDVFEDMRERVEARLRDDARMRTSTAWDAWRTTINRTLALLGPLGYIPSIAVPMQMGTGLVGLGTQIDEGINGRTEAQRADAVGNALMTVVMNGSAAAALRQFAPNAQSKPNAGPLAGDIASIPSTPGAGSALASAAAAAEDVRVAVPMGAVSSDPLPWQAASVEVLPAKASAPGSTTTSDPLAGSQSTGGQVHSQKSGNTTSSDRPAVVSDSEAEGYLVQHVATDSNSVVRQVIDLKKSRIDEKRSRLDEFRMESIATNLAGYNLSFDRSLVFRVDSRTPGELLRGDGFGPSSEFNDLQPMLRQPSTIGSGSLEGSNRVFESW